MRHSLRSEQCVFALLWKRFYAALILRLRLGHFFAILMEGVGFSAYSRYQAIRSGIIGFTISWTHDDAQNAVLHGERLATLMSDLFRANIELGLPRSPPMPRPAIVAALPHGQMASPQTAIPPGPEGKKQDNQKSF